MRAVAHPVRLALLEALIREGPLTATQAAELLDDSPGNMSWHLQTLAKYGFVEETGDGRGRRRPWRVDLVVAPIRHRPRRSRAGRGRRSPGSDFMERTYQRLRDWWTQRRSYSIKWRRAAFTSDALTYLTAEEMSELGDKVSELFMTFHHRTLDRSARPEGAVPVHLVAFGHPLPPTPSGN